MDGRSKKLLFDVVSSCRSILEWCEKRTFEEYVADRFLRRAVKREFEIAGEALNRLSQADAETAGRIRDLPRIVSFRNRIIHGYDTVDDATVWGVIEGHLPTLLADAEALLASPYS
ncbi:MAG: DUF86 domain-containing protein [Chloroflexi bacterium]|nr:DUF86 domain-containing protein [Chloroflexota bacterium]